MASIRDGIADMWGPLTPILGSRAGGAGQGAAGRSAADPFGLMRDLQDL